MDFQDIKNKTLQGCGCISIGIVIMMIIVILIGIYAEDEDSKGDAATTEQKDSTQVKKDSVVVNEPLQGDPYQELDELIGLTQVKDEVHQILYFLPLGHYKVT